MINLLFVLYPYLYTNAQKIDVWLRDSLRQYLGSIVDNPTKYKEIAKRFESKEFEFIHLINEKALILKKNGEIVARMDLQESEDEGK